MFKLDKWETTMVTLLCYATLLSTSLDLFTLGVAAQAVMEFLLLGVIICCIVVLVSGTVWQIKEWGWWDVTMVILYASIVLLVVWIFFPTYFVNLGQAPLSTWAVVLIGVVLLVGGTTFLASKFSFTHLNSLPFVLLLTRIGVWEAPTFTSQLWISVLLVAVSLPLSLSLTLFLSRSGTSLVVLSSVLGWAIGHGVLRLGELLHLSHWITVGWGVRTAVVTLVGLYACYKLVNGIQQAGWLAAVNEQGETWLLFPKLIPLGSERPFPSTKDAPWLVDVVQSSEGSLVSLRYAPDVPPSLWRLAWQQWRHPTIPSTTPLVCIGQRPVAWCQFKLRPVTLFPSMADLLRELPHLIPGRTEGRRWGMQVWVRPLRWGRCEYGVRLWLTGTEQSNRPVELAGFQQRVNEWLLLRPQQTGATLTHLQSCRFPLWRMGETAEKTLHAFFPMSLLQNFHPQATPAQQAAWVQGTTAASRMCLPDKRPNCLVYGTTAMGQEVGQLRQEVQQIIITGTPQTGKTTLIASLAAQWRIQGSSLLLLDGDGSLATELVYRLPVDQLTSLLIFDPAGIHPYGYNPFAHACYDPIRWAEAVKAWLQADSPALDKQAATVLHFASLLAWLVEQEKTTVRTVAAAVFEASSRQQQLFQLQTMLLPPGWQGYGLAATHFWQHTFPHWPETTQTAVVSALRPWLSPFHHHPTVPWPTGEPAVKGSGLWTSPRIVIVRLTDPSQMSFLWAKELLHHFAACSSASAKLLILDGLSQERVSQLKPPSPTPSMGIVTVGETGTITAETTHLAFHAPGLVEGVWRVNQETLQLARQGAWPTLGKRREQAMGQFYAPSPTRPNTLLQEPVSPTYQVWRETAVSLPYAARETAKQNWLVGSELTEADKRRLVLAGWGQL